MKNLAIINDCFPIDYRDIIHGYISQIETILSNYDIVVFMARKAICFYHALKSVGAFDNHDTAIVFSSRSLTYNDLSILKDKKIALIDDVVVEGTTLRKSLDIFAENDLFPDIYMAACRKDFISEKIAPYEERLSTKAVFLSDSNIYAFATYIIRFIEMTKCPYNIDYPIYNVKFDSVEHFICFINKFAYINITTPLQKKMGIDNYVINFNHHILNQMTTNANMHFVKIRIMHFSGSNEATLIPFVLFHEVNFEQLDSLYEVINTEINSKKINSGSQEQIAENRLKIVQYMYSDFLAMNFIKDAGLTAKKDLALEKENIGFLMPKNQINNIFPLDISNSKYCTQESVDIITFNKYINAAYDTILKRKHLGTRYHSKTNYIYDDVLTLCDFELICKDMTIYEDEIYNEFAVSNMIDIFVDKGYLVPVTLFSNEGLVRGYKCGEVTKLTEKELKLFSAMLAYYQNSTTTDYMDRIEFEKLCVLFFRDCHKQNIISEYVGDIDEDCYNICYTRFGPRVSQASNKKYGVERDTSFADFLLENAGVKEVSEINPITHKNEYKYEVTYGSEGKLETFSRDEKIMCLTFADDMAKFKSLYPSYEEQSVFKKDTSNKQNYFKYAVSFNEFLTLLSIGNSNKDRLLSLIAEIHLLSKVKLSEKNIGNQVSKIISSVSDGIDSGLWKYWCYSQKDLLENLFTELSIRDNHSTRVMRGVLNYSTRQTDISPVLISYINDCGLFLYKTAYTLFYLAEKYKLCHKERTFNKRYFFWAKFNNLRHEIKQKICTSSETEDFILLKEMQKEALAYTSLCDLYIDRSFLENNHYTDILTIYSEKKKEIEEKIGNRYIQLYKSTSLDCNKYIFMRYDKTNSSAQLKTVLNGCTDVEPLIIIVSEMNKWYEGLYGERNATKGVHFEKIILEIINKNAEIDCPASKILLICTKKEDKTEPYQIPGYDIALYDSYIISSGYIVTRYTIYKQGENNIMNITITDNNNTQVQINTKNSKQNIQEKSAIPYDDILKSLLEIQKYEANFEDEFNEKASEFKSLLDNAINYAEEKKEEKKLLRILSTLKDIAINVGSGIIASGIYLKLSEFVK